MSILKWLDEIMKAEKEKQEMLEGKRGLILVFLLFIQISFPPWSTESLLYSQQTFGAGGMWTIEKVIRAFTEIHNLLTILDH